MTENKRFTIENDVEMKDNWNINKRCYHFGNGFDAKDCCNMLNELLEENQDFKAFNKELAEELSVCANARISKDNRIEKLEEKIQRERTSFTKTQARWSKEAENKIKELADENEQLKKQLESEHTMLDNAILLERTRMGQSALKQYKEAIQ